MFYNEKKIILNSIEKLESYLVKYIIIGGIVFLGEVFV